jgi:hypothetical protein
VQAVELESEGSEEEEAEKTDNYDQLLQASQ